ncbi:MAG: sulfotransferase [Candidatus Binataceae bacterium]
METQKPNFFLAGAAKCGTTSFSAYLAAHPLIFFSRPKEPHFFSSDFYEHSRVWSMRGYMRLFREAGPQHLAIGEGSVWYIASQVAVRNILEFNPRAKFIVMVRSPVQMAPSLHSQNLFDCIDDELDFERAWRLQEQRRAGEKIPFLCCEPKELFYSDRCMLGAQLARLYQQVPRERVKVIVLEDMSGNPRAAYEDALEFLGVPSDGRTEFPIKNENKVARYPGWNKMLAFGGKCKKLLRVQKSFPWGDSLIQFKAARRKPLKPELEFELCRHFAADVEQLSHLLDHDLTGWLRPDDSAAAERQSAKVKARVSSRQLILAE